MDAIKWFIVLSLATVSGCVTSARKSDDGLVEANKQVVVGIFEKNGTAIGVRFTPSETEEWIKAKSTSTMSLSLKRKGASNDEGWEIEGYPVTLDILTDSLEAYSEKIIKNVREDYGKAMRYRIESLDVMPYPDKGSCVKVHILMEETKPVRTVSHQSKKWIDQYVLSCGLVKNRGGWC